MALEPPTYEQFNNEDYPNAPSGDALLEVEGGLTANQRSGRSRRSLFAGGGGGGGGSSCVSDHVSHHVLVLYGLWFIAFVIACSAMAKANRLDADGGAGAGGARSPEDGSGVDGGAVNHWLSRCEYMEYALYGEAPGPKKRGRFPWT